MSLPQNKSISLPQGPLLIKVSLRKHTPQEIYDYINKHVGDLGMKIKKRQAIIGFENQKLYHKLINQHQNVMLHGKKLEFKFIPKADQNYVMSQQEEIKEMALAAGPAMMNPQFVSKNNVQARVHFYRVQMLEKVNKLFDPTIETVRKRTGQMKLQFKQKGPFQRQMTAMEKAVEKKLQKLQQKYQADMKNFHKYIRQFSQKPTNIDLQPKFCFQQALQFQFPIIPLNNMKFQTDNYFKNSELLQCKRLCAINGQQFALTMFNQKQSLIKLYNVNQSDQKKSLNMDSGVYGLCRINNFLLIGSCDSRIKYVNLADPDYQVERTGILNQGSSTAQYRQLKILKPSCQKAEIVSLFRDKSLGTRIKLFNLSFDEIGQGITSLTFQQKLQLQAAECQCIQVKNKEVIMFGGVNKIRKHHFERKHTKEIPIHGKCLKIKKFNENLLAAATQKMIQLADQRTDTVVQTFTHMPKQLRCIQVVGEHSLMYGAFQQVGLLDDRMHDIFPWKSQGQHNGVVYDLLKLKNKVVSCDSNGGIFSWKLRQLTSAPIQVQFRSQHF